MPDSDIQTPSPRFTNLRIQLKILLWDNFLLKSSWKLSLQRYVKCFVKSAQILSNYNTFQASQSHHRPHAPGRSPGMKQIHV